MSETTVCPNCAASIPSTASFCTSCGHNLAAAAPAPAPPAPPSAPAEPAPADPGPDATRIETPGLNDSTQVLPTAAPPAAPPAPEPAAWAPPPADPPPAPWAPASTDAPAAPTPPAPAAWEQPAAPAAAAPTAWEQPAAPAAPAWQAPEQSPYGAPAGTAPAWGAPAPAPTSSPAGGGSPLGGLAAVVGGALTLVGIFTAWIGAEGSDSTVKGWDLTSGDKVFKSNDPYLLLALGIAIIAIGVALFLGKAKPIAKIAAIVAGVVVIGVCVRDWTSIADLVKEKEAFRGINVKAQFGFYLTIAGGALAAIGGVLPAEKS